MTDDSTKPNMSKNDPSDRTTLDLKGSKNHHKLKDQPGEDGDENHTTETESDPDVAGMVKKVVSDSERETPIASALKKAVEE